MTKWRRYLIVVVIDSSFYELRSLVSPSKRRLDGAVGLQESTDKFGSSFKALAFAFSIK
jgi:hypothetical protein